MNEESSFLSFMYLIQWESLGPKLWDDINELGSLRAETKLHSIRAERPREAPATKDSNDGSKEGQRTPIDASSHNRVRAHGDAGFSKGVKHEAFPMNVSARQHEINLP